MSDLSSLTACRTCGFIQSAPAERCGRCGAAIRPRAAGSLHRTAAFAAAALLLYAPANIFPIMRMNMYGATAENTVLQGCVKLYRDGDPILAVIVFLASVLVPFLKLLGLLTLAVFAKWRPDRWRRGRSRIHRVIDSIGRWAMLDVFMLAIAVSLIKMQRLASIVPGKGAAAFAAVVVLTMLASQSFDPASIWEKEP